MRNRHYFSRILIVCFIIFISISGVVPINAQTPTPTPTPTGDWCQEADFRTGQHGFSPVDYAGTVTTYVPGTGFVGTIPSGAYPDLSIIAVAALTFPSATTITSAWVTFHVNDTIASSSMIGVLAWNDPAGSGGYAANSNIPASTSDVTDTLSLSASITTMNFRAQAGPPAGGTQTGSATLVDVIYCGEGIAPPESPDVPTNTFANCPLLGIANANFTSLPGNWTLTGDAAQAEGHTSGLQFGIGSASLTLALSISHQYRIDVNYDNPTSTIATFSIGLGANPSNRIEAAATATGTATIAAANYRPGVPGGTSRDSADSKPDLSAPGIYTLLIERNDAVPDELDRDGNPIPADPIIINSVCITDTTPGAVGNGTGSMGSGATATSVPSDCSVGCSFSFSGGDGSLLGILGALPSFLQGLFAYLLCGVLKWYRCVLAPGLGGIWTTVQNVLYTINIARIWFGLIWQNAGGWLSSVLHIISLFVGGTLTNVIQTVLNAIAIVLNNLGILNIVNGVLAFIQSLIQGAGNVITFISSLVQGFGSIIGSIISFVFNVLVVRFTELIQTITGIFTALISAVNVSAVAPPGVPVCDTSASMIPASCVGLFIIDNSVLADGSVFGTLLPLLQGGAGIGVLWWAANRIKKAVSNYAESE